MIGEMRQMENDSSIALITGANKGIGFETARRLGMQGYTVLMGARSKEKGGEAASELRTQGINAQCMEIDVTSQTSIDEAVQTIHERYGRLDVLVNNAGIFRDRSTLSGLDMDDLRETFETNFFGAFAVSKAMLPFIRQSASGRIVNVSSEMGSLTRHGDAGSEVYPKKALAYGSSKTALNQLTVHLAFELRDTPAKVNSVCPGFVATDLNHHQGTQSAEHAARLIAAYATLPQDGPTGRFFNENGELPW